MEKKLQSLPKNKNKLEDNLNGDLIESDLYESDFKLPESTEKRVENILLYAKCDIIIHNFL
ncbi:MAG: hypothetical protein ACOX4D_03020 [Bacteroidales bacterium]|jgi:hypothetical protein